MDTSITKPHEPVADLAFLQARTFIINFTVIQYNISTIC